jgi:hypothetical protein
MSFAECHMPGKDAQAKCDLRTLKQESSAALAPLDEWAVFGRSSGVRQIFSRY